MATQMTIKAGDLRVGDSLTHPTGGPATVKELKMLTADDGVEVSFTNHIVHTYAAERPVVVTRPDIEDMDDAQLHAELDRRQRARRLAMVIDAQLTISSLGEQIQELIDDGYTGALQDHHRDLERLDECLSSMKDLLV